VDTVCVLSVGREWITVCVLSVGRDWIPVCVLSGGREWITVSVLSVGRDESPSVCCQSVESGYSLCVVSR
jgi:hypothetical protein